MGLFSGKISQDLKKILSPSITLTEKWPTWVTWTTLRSLRMEQKTTGRWRLSRPWTTEPLEKTCLLSKTKPRDERGVGLVESRSGVARAVYTTGLGERTAQIQTGQMDLVRRDLLRVGSCL